MVKSIKIILIILILLIIVNVIEIYYVFSIPANGQQEINMSLFKNSNYIITKDDGITEAINGITREVDYHSEDATEVIQNVNDHLEEGDTIYMMPGIYDIKGLHLKPINLIGSGKSTILRVIDNSNNDIIEIYSGGNLGNRMYYNRGKIANLKIDGNKNNQKSGNGIVLAWTSEYIIENVWITNVKDYGIKILRSYWTSLRDISISDSGFGIKIGEYDIEGKYNNKESADLFSNENTFTNVHITCTDRNNIDIGVHIESGDANNFIGSDTSGCGIGVLLKAINGIDHVYSNNFIGHWFESDVIGIKMENGGNAGTRYTYIINPVFSGNKENINSSNDSGHYILISDDHIGGGAYSPDIDLYRLYIRYGIYKGIGTDRIFIQDPVHIQDIYNMRTYTGDFLGNFSEFVPPYPQGVGHFFFAIDTNKSNPGKRMYVSFDGIAWNYTTFF